MSLFFYFDLKLIQHSYIFCDNDQPLEKDLALFRISLICNYFSEDEWNLYFGDSNSTQSESSDNEDSKNYDNEDSQNSGDEDCKI